MSPKSFKARIDAVQLAQAHVDRIAELEAAKAAAAHEPDCNYWQWDWRYSWHVSDCSCKRIADLERET